MHIHRAHGLTVSCEFPLPGLPQLSDGAAAASDLTIVSGRPPGAPRGPAGVLAFDSTPGRRLRLSALASGGLHTEAKGIEIWLDPDFSTMHVDLADTDEARAAAPWLVGGLGIAVALLARGELMMHATMVELDGRGHLLMAPAGHGKTLTAAAACAAGATLIAEDTTCIVTSPDGIRRAPTGSNVLRTRRSREELGAWFDSDQLSESSDGRTLVRFDEAERLVTVDRLHLVVLDADAAAPSVVGVDSSTAVVHVLGHVRVPGLLPGPELDRHFDAVAGLVDDAMVDVIRLPFTGDIRPLPAALIESLRAAHG